MGYALHQGVVEKIEDLRTKLMATSKNLDQLGEAYKNQTILKMVFVPTWTGHRRRVKCHIAILTWNRLIRHLTFIYADNSLYELFNSFQIM